MIGMGLTLLGNVSADQIIAPGSMFRRVLPRTSDGLMIASDETSNIGGSKMSLIAFGLVWIVGIVLSFVTFRLAISGRLWDLGFPVWLIPLTVLVGVWQWIWIAPILGYAKRRNRFTLYYGLLWGGVSFSVLQLALAIVMYLMFRKISMQ